MEVFELAVFPFVFFELVGACSGALVAVGVVELLSGRDLGGYFLFGPMWFSTGLLTQVHCFTMLEDGISSKYEKCFLCL